MAQLQLPIFPAGYTPINTLVGFQKKDNRIYYFHGSFPLYSHAQDDYESFKVITSQMIVSGSVKQSEIVRAFGVSASGVKRNVKRLHEKGLRGLLGVTRGGTARADPGEGTSGATSFGSGSVCSQGGAPVGH